MVRMVARLSRMAFGNAEEVASYERDARAFHGHVGAGAHGNPDFGLPERGCVVDAIASHRDTQLLDVGDSFVLTA
jgi:hypothetical protein